MTPARLFLPLLFVLLPMVACGEQEPVPSPPKKEEKIPDLQGDPSDLYFQAWLRWKNGESFQKADKLEEAKWSYHNALLQMKGIRKKWPDWK